MSEMYQTVMDKASELGDIITQTEEFKKVKEKQAIMFKDNTAMELLKEYNNLQQKQKEKQDSGEQLTEEDQKEMQEAESKLAENELVKDFFDAQNEFQQMLNSAMELIIKPCRE